MLRMNLCTFHQLYTDLKNIYGLQPSNRILILKKVGLFVYILSKGASNRDAQERFQHSGETTSRIFREVLDATEGFCKDKLKTKDPEFKDVPLEIANDNRYMPHFKVSPCLLSIFLLCIIQYVIFI